MRVRAAQADVFGASCFCVLGWWALSGCGGGQAASETPKATQGGATEALGVQSANGTPPPASTGEAGGATTTGALIDSGELQGARLREVPSAASASDNARQPPHGHDPGRQVGVIKAMIVAHRDEARACYEAGLAAHPELEGDLVVQWTIDPTGKVTQVSLDEPRSTITEPSVVACVADVIRKLQFSESAGGYETRASYPFNFHPHRGEGPASRP
jgi:hypothetical protein